MKRIMLVMAALLGILIGCSQTPKTATISGNVQFEGHDPAKKVYVGLYPEVFDYTDNVGEPIELLELTKPEFTLQAKPGRYGLVVWAFPFEKYQTNILLPDAKDDIHFNITLPHYGLQEEFDGYFVLGDFNDWSGNGNLPMKKEGDKWILPDSSRLPLNSAYKFISGNKGFLDLSNAEFVLVENWCTFNNIYKGGPVVIDPSLYAPVKQEAKAEIQGGEATIRFNQLRSELNALRSEKILPVLRGMQNLPDENKLETWEAVNLALDSLETAYPELNQMVLDERFGLIQNLHPRNVKRTELLIAKAPLKAFYQSDTNTAYLKYYLNLAKKIDPTSELINGNFTRAHIGFQYDLDQNPETAEHLGIVPNYFDQQLAAITETGTDRIIENLCITAGSHYGYSGQADKARTYLNLLKTNYPNSRYVKEGHVDRILKSLTLAVGSLAPDFSVTTISGKTFTLSDHKGKFIFIDFWGTWCSPCRGEVPNFEKLYETIPHDSLIVIGVANDDSTALAQFIAEQKIPYPNAIATKDIIEAYAVNAYPTLFLIGPDGKIAGKGLRGETVVKQVRDKMKEYGSNSQSSEP